MKSQYKTLSSQHAFELIENFLKEQKVDVEKYEKIKGEGVPYDEEEFIHLQEIIRKEMAKKSKKPSSNERSSVEFSTAKWLHQILSYDKNAFSDVEFWLWLSIKYFRDFIKWRAGGTPTIKIANFGINSSTSVSITENVLYRMWVRANIGYNEELNDPYKNITPTKTYDFWQSFIVRRDFANIECISKAFINKLFEAKLNTNEYREIGKWLTGIQSNLLFNSLTDEQAENLLKNKIEEIRKEH
jgi:hypothetical protein